MILIADVRPKSWGAAWTISASKRKYKFLVRCGSPKYTSVEPARVEPAWRRSAQVTLVMSPSAEDRIAPSIAAERVDCRWSRRISPGSCVAGFERFSGSLLPSGPGRLPDANRRASQRRLGRVFTRTNTSPRWSRKRRPNPKALQAAGCVRESPDGAEGKKRMEADYPAVPATRGACVGL